MRIKIARLIIFGIGILLQPSLIFSRDCLSYESSIVELYGRLHAQSFVDLAFLVIKEMGLKSPENDYESFEILSGQKVISSELASNLQQAKGMRNILAHEYGEVDNEIVFNSINEELIRDGNEFIKSIQNLNF